MALAKSHFPSCFHPGFLLGFCERRTLQGLPWKRASDHSIGRLRCIKKVEKAQLLAVFDHSQ